MARTLSVAPMHRGADASTDASLDAPAVATTAMSFAVGSNECNGSRCRADTDRDSIALELRNGTIGRVTLRGRGEFHQSKWPLAIPVLVKIQELGLVFEVH
jgi:hypothetical protein